MTQSTVWLSSDFTLLFCVCSPLKQPHNILQKRLMETNLSKFRGSRGSWAPKDLSSQTNKLNQTRLGSSGKTEDEELIVVSCQVIIPPQPFVGFLLQILFPTVSGCALVPHVSQSGLCSHRTVTAGDTLPLQLQAAVAEEPTWDLQRKLV